MGKKVDVNFTPEELTLDLQAFSDMVLRPAMIRLAIRMLGKEIEEKRRLIRQMRLEVERMERRREELREQIDGGEDQTA